MIRKITEFDREEFFALVREFYTSEAVLHPVPKENHEALWVELMRGSPFCEMYLVEHEGAVAGYMQLSYTFSQEAGGRTAWLEELYIRPQFQRRGLGHECFAYIAKYIEPTVRRIRLEIEPDNDGARRLYESMGFESLGYAQMVKEIAK